MGPYKAKCIIRTGKNSNCNALFQEQHTAETPYKGERSEPKSPFKDGKDARNRHVRTPFIGGECLEERYHQPHLVQVQHLYWAVHFTCADCGALLTQQPKK